ncbi:hypothetical protein ELQ39_27945 [Streptomyces sp. GB4-14]|uniref:hypothetical protein n=1 Tax=Streptomyces sp. GB4-14 TaxID=2498703 RepID=UPI001F5EBE7E|nr:hypothetical protein [Streptomyces sp. GB4-14]
MTDQNATESPQERPEGGSTAPCLSETENGVQAGADGLDPPAHNAGPTVAECAEADRRWPLQKHGE